MTKRFKIEPDLTCPELAGYKLPPCSRCQEDGVVKKLSDLFTSVGHNFEIAMPELKEGLIELCKAREKFEFSESDLRRALSMAFIAVQDGGNITSDEIIQSLSTQRTPIAIDVEMDSTKSLLGVWTGFIPATNPDGTVKGVYVYE